MQTDYLGNLQSYWIKYCYLCYLSEVHSDLVMILSWYSGAGRVSSCFGYRISSVSCLQFSLNHWKRYPILLPVPIIKSGHLFHFQFSLQVPQRCQRSRSDSDLGDHLFLHGEGSAEDFSPGLALNSVSCRLWWPPKKISQLRDDPLSCPTSSPVFAWLSSRQQAQLSSCWGNGILIGILILVTKRSETVCGVDRCLFLSSLGRLAARFLAFTRFGLLCSAVRSTIFPWFDIIIIRLIMG